MGLLRYLHPRPAVARHFYYCRFDSLNFWDKGGSQTRRYAAGSF